MNAHSASAAGQPLSVSWREWLQSHAWRGREYAGAPFDAVVVGSGYGGSVAALRLARKGWRVLLLERGSEYLPGEFPNDFSLVPKFFRVNVPGPGAPAGRATGLLEVHLGQGMVAVTGNGLGGGSLVNAGVVIRPDEDVFSQPQWPAAIRQAPGGGLAPFFDRAAAQLRAADWKSGLPDGSALNKTAGLHRLAAGLGVRGSGVSLTVDPQSCTRCGDCASGCNVPDAKGTLASTYLREALRTGQVQIVTQAEVYRFEQARGRDGRHAGWTVHAFATDAQHQFAATRELFADRQDSATARAFTAPVLFVCAGTVGSTRLLQRSQSLSGGALAFSPALGTRVSGNGDSVSWVTDEAQRVDSVSRGQAGVQAWEQASAGRPFDRNAIVGPTITAMLDLRQPAAAAGSQPRPLPLQERVLIEDCAVPRAIAQLFRELLATTRTLRQLDGWWFRGARFAGAEREDPLAASDEQAQHTQTLLAMGHDGSPARLVWLEGLDSSAPYLPEPEKLRVYQRQQEIFDGWGVRHVHNPLWQAMPRDAARLLTGPKPPHVVTTVHPLGGCVMADDPAGGVVDDRGQVWVHDPGRGFLRDDAMEPVRGSAGAGGRNAPRLYKGLYVLDGSIVPTSLGCNPLWTITALAERALEAMPDRIPAPPPPAGTAFPARSEPRAPQAFPSREVRVDALLHEVLTAKDVRVGGALARHLGAGEVWARLDATFDTADIQSRMRTARHRTRARGSLVLGGAPPRQDEVQLRYAITRGYFTPLPAGPGSTGPLPLLRSLLEPLAVPAAALVLWSAAGPVAAVAAALALAVLLPFPRSLLTWLVLRGTRDIAERGFGAEALRSSPAAILALWKQLVHASEKRVMRYHLRLQLQQPAPPDVPRTLILRATKRVTYRASLPEVLAWLLRRTRPCEAGGTEPVPVRATFWEQIMDAEVRVAGPGPLAALRPLLRGRLRMGFDNLTASGLSPSRRNARGAMELGLRGDTTSGLLALASYPLLFLRYALKTRLLDFRLPSYSNLPLPDCAPPAETELRIGADRVQPVCHWLPVERGQSSSDDGTGSEARLHLPLWRYRRPGAGHPEITQGSWMGVPVARAKSVLLLHAFGQSGLSYTLKTVEENLAERFWREGYEVWVLEMRMSTRSGHAGEPCSVDQIARHDLPEAVRHIVQTIARETGVAQPVQVGAFAQCIGAAALWMALLSGRLSHGQPGGEDVDDARPLLSMLSHAMFSQVHPWIVGARGTQSKTWVPDLLQVLWRRGAVPFGVRGAQDGLFMMGVDRLLASLPAPRAEDRRPRGDDDAAATCRRIRFIEAPLFQHRNINDATFAAMNLLFGEANLRLFAHARRFVDRERLVDEDGVNRYVTDDNLRRHLCFPVQLLHGEANELFDVASARRSFARLREVQGRWQHAFCREGREAPQPVIAPGYGHLDVLIGQDAAREVYPRIVGFFDRCLARVHHRVRGRIPGRWAARAPAVGPFLGWLRTEGGQALLRVSFVVDERGGTPPAGALPPIRVRYPSATLQRHVSLAAPVDWKAWRVAPLAQQGGADPYAVHLLAWGDIPLPPDCDRGQDWQVFTLHESRFAADWLLPSPDAPDPALDAYLERFRSAPRVESVIPPLSDGHAFDFAGARFRLPAEALETLAAPDRVRLAVGCCRHPGFGLDLARVDHTVKAFLQRHEREPVAFAMLLGDQIYADATAGLMDPFSPYQRFCERYEMAFDRQGVGRLLAAMPVYMTPDDHEWTDCFPLEGPLVREPWAAGGARQGFGQRNEDAIALASQATTAFQRLQSPLGDVQRGYYVFRHGCARFFVIDSRLERERNQPQVVGAYVLASLASWLGEAEAGEMLNVVACGSVVLPGLRPNADPANPGVLDTWQYAPAQRQQLLDLLVSRAGGRFLLLSGDYHVSGAGYVRRGPDVVGAAVVAPPLYAPMPYANATPESVDLDERVPLPAGLVSLEFPQQGDIARGSGLGVLDVRRSGSGFEVTYARELRVWEEGAARSWNVRLQLPGGAPVAQPAPPVPCAPAVPVSAPPSTAPSAGPGS